jgi:tRNA(Ile2) C34 agmatinyltransferase TiaS
MDVRVGDILAKCLECGGTEFQCAGEELRCRICGTRTTRTALLMQIGDEAAKQARESLARLKRDPAKR